MTAVHAPAGSTPAPAARHRLALSGRASVLLDVLMGLSVVSGLLVVASMAAGPPPATSCWC